MRRSTAPASDVAAIPSYLEQTAKEVDRPDRVPTTAADVPALLFQLCRMPSLSAERRVEFAAHLARNAVDDNTTPESALAFAVALTQLLAEFEGLPGVTDAMLHVVRWRAFELWVRSGLSFEAQQMAEIAFRSGPIPDEALREMARWARNPQCATLLMDVLERQAAQPSATTEARRVAIEAASRNLSTILEEGFHDAR